MRRRRLENIFTVENAIGALKIAGSLAIGAGLAYVYDKTGFSDSILNIQNNKSGPASQIINSILQSYNNNHGQLITSLILGGMSSVPFYELMNYLDKKIRD